MYYDSVNYCFRFEIQLSLLKGSWSQLFILGLTQCAHALSLIPVLSSMITHLQNEEIHNSSNSSKAKEVKTVRYNYSLSCKISIMMDEN